MPTVEDVLDDLTLQASEMCIRDRVRAKGTIKFI